MSHYPDPDDRKMLPDRKKRAPGGDQGCVAANDRIR